MCLYYTPIYVCFAIYPLRGVSTKLKEVVKLFHLTYRQVVSTKLKGPDGIPFNSKGLVNIKFGGKRNLEDVLV